MSIKITWRTRGDKSTRCGNCETRIAEGHRYADVAMLGRNFETMRLCMSCGNDLENLPEAMIHKHDDLQDIVDRALDHAESVRYENACESRMEDRRVGGW